MSRWLTAARAAMAANQPAAPPPPGFGDCGDIGEPAAKADRPRRDPGEAAERAATPGPLDPPYRHTAGLLAASRPRIPPSWADHAKRPQRGAMCACCRGARWWGDANGWRCCTCYGPLPGNNPDIVET